MKQTNMALRKRVQFNLSIYDSMLSWSSLSSLVSLIILTIAWLIILVVVNQYFIRRRRLEKERLDNQLKLKKINENLSQSENSLKQKAKDLELAMQELKLNQIQMVQSEKMSSLGLLVAGIAHEINNPITFIHGNIRYVEEYSNSLLGLVKIYQKCYPEPVTELQDAFNEFNIDFIQKDLPKTLKSINSGSERICQIVSLLRNFSRMDENDFKLVDIHEGINSTLLIVQYYIKSKDNMPEIQILKEYGDLPLVECYAGALNQVFLNILNNAIDALEEVNIHSNETSCEFRDRQIQICTTIEADWVQIIIADNGVGMTEQVRQKIFDPFFTTKPVGKGTGLGMSISYKIIVEQHKGILECHSTPNQGTEFLIRIPLR
jgi:signal transduction histidine kinase